MNIFIVGAGSIGVYLGTMLDIKGHNVVLLGREKLKQLNDTLLIGDIVFRLPERIYTIPKNKSFDFIFITSKLYDLEKNLQEITKNNILAKFIICIQNGIVEERVFQNCIKNDNIESITVYEGYRLLKNKLIVNQGKPGWKTYNSKAGKETEKILQNTGINFTAVKHPYSLKAEKTIMNCCVNVLSANRKKTFFELYNNPETKKMMDELFEESYKVLSTEYKLQPIKKLRAEFYGGMKTMKHYSSVYQDATSGRKTEIDYLNGFIVKLGKKHKVPTPANQQLIENFFKEYSKPIS